MNTQTNRAVFRVGVGGLAVTAILALAMLSFAGVPERAKAQAPSCSTATVSGQGDGRFAIADVGNAIASFVCITTSNGQRSPISSNGRTTDNCFTVDGIGTAVPRVVKTDPAILPNCPDLLRIDVGVVTQTGTTPTATAPTAAPTATTAAPTPSVAAPTPTLVVPTATPFVPTVVVATPSATPTVRPPAPLPPATGNGRRRESSAGPAPLGVALFALAAGAVCGLVLAARRKQ